MIGVIGGILLIGLIYAAGLTLAVAWIFWVSGLITAREAR